MAATPDLVWQLLDWSWRGDVVIVEWQCSRFVAGRKFSWRGVDKFVVKDGMIVEERVYMDTAPLRAARDGKALRSEEHTSELQSLMRLSYAVFCLKKQDDRNINTQEWTLNTS